MRNHIRWLLPGLGVKRWLLLSVVGVFVVGLGFSLAVRGNLYSRVEYWLLTHLSYTSEIFWWTPWIMAVLLVVSGLTLYMTGFLQLGRSVLRTLLPPSEGMAETFYQRRFLGRGPKVVAVGGGTGIPTLLRGLKHYTANITAVVTVADDGGSSGRLRTEFGILPPGDIRNCLVALADTETLMERLFQHRFTNGDGLTGHPFGNLLILAMTETTGNFYDAVRASSQILAIRGRVMPATLDQVVLKAQLESGGIVVGESLIGRSPSPIRRLYLERVAPEPDGSKEIQPLTDALHALEQADIIVLGPGSLYTSILPNLLVPGVADAVRRSRALKVYVCNVMTQPGETDQYTVSQHIQALIDHAGYGIINTCLVNSQPISEPLLKKYLEQHAIPVRIDAKESQRLGVEVVRAALLDDNQEYVRHDPDKLAREISQLFLNRRVNLERTPWDFFLLRQRLQASRREAKD